MSETIELNFHISEISENTFEILEKRVVSGAELFLQKVVDGAKLP